MIKSGQVFMKGEGVKIMGHPYHYTGRGSSSEHSDGQSFVVDYSMNTQMEGGWIRAGLGLGQYLSCLTDILPVYMPLL